MKEFSLNLLEKQPTHLPWFLNADSGKYSPLKPIILFGSGEWGIYYAKFLKNFFNGNILFCDNNSKKWGTAVEGIPVISFDELKRNYGDCCITITTLNYYNEILKQLEENNLMENVAVSLQGFVNNDYTDYYNVVSNNFNSFAKVYDFLSDEHSKYIFIDRINFCISGNKKYLIHLRSRAPQYFEPGIITLTENEIFVDGGAYTGDTVNEFLNQTKGSFKRIYSFEPETSKHKEFLSKYSYSDNIELLPYGLWNKKELLRFSAQNSGGSHVNVSGNIEIPVISIDEVLQGQPVTFIKMDIEGAELEALKGAENTIRMHKPKLAVCVYHKPLDIIQIPLYIKKIVPEYNIYFRHYNINMYETVCYAVADQTIQKGETQYEY